VVTEELGVDGIDSSKVVHVLEENGSFYNLVDTAAAGHDDLSEILECLCCLCLDPAIDDGHGSGIEGNATGNEDEAACLDRL